MQWFTYRSVRPVGPRSLPGSPEGLGLFTEQLLRNTSLEDFSASLPALVIVCLVYHSPATSPAVGSLVWISISLGTSDFEHLFSAYWSFLYLLWRNICFLKKWDYLGVFVFCFFFLLFSYKTSLYILITSTLSGEWYLQIFSSVLWLLFSLPWWCSLTHRQL